MLNRTGIVATSFLLLVLAGVTDIVVQAQEPAANSFRFNQPIPVTIRKTNNSIIQTMLVGIDEKGITVMAPFGKTVEHPNNTFRIVRSPNGSFSYSPGKDDVNELIQRLNQAQPANGNPNGALPNGAGGVPGQPGAGGVPFTVSGASPQPAGAHSQPGSAFPPALGGNNAGANPANNASAEMERMMAHSQATAANGSRPGSAGSMPPGGHSQTPYSTSPMPTMPGTHSQMPPATMPHSMPNPQMPMMPNMNMPNMNPSPQQMMYQYECMKCRHRITSAVEMQAGAKCPSCGVIWGHVQDEHGRITSSSPAAKIGGGVGLVVVVIGIIAAIVRKVNAA
jgi:hypothetical protein